MISAADRTYAYAPLRNPRTWLRPGTAVAKDARIAPRNSLLSPESIEDRTAN
jgi:hypothetical protein